MSSNLISLQTFYSIQLCSVGYKNMCGKVVVRIIDFFLNKTKGIYSGAFLTWCIAKKMPLVTSYLHSLVFVLK